MKPALRLRYAEATLMSVGTKHTTPSSYTCVIHNGGSTPQGRRSIHASPRQAKPATAVASHPPPSSSPTSTSPESSPSSSTPSALSVLPLSQVLRTYLITSISSSPALLGASTSLLRRMLNSRNPLFRLDTNPLMRALLWETFYKQFCAGETEAQVAKRCTELREQGYAGVILEYAPEVLADAEGNEVEDVAFWRKGMLDSVHMAAPGDFIGLKWSGMGPKAMRRMADDKEPTERMSEAMHTVCKAATEKGVALLPAAEETWSLTGFHNWSLSMQRVYNMNGKSVVYNTHQAYLKQTPQNIAKELAMAKKEGFTLGLKLVRGAYLGSDDRTLIHPTIEATHACYDGLASALIHRAYNSTLHPTPTTTTATETNQQFPPLNIVLATHNIDSVKQAQALRQAQASRNETLTPLKYAQLQGMADEVSCRLIADAKASAHDDSIGKEQVFKCTTWGPIYDCLQYLLRRAAENKDAASRTGETRRAMRTEIWRRVRGVVGLA